MTYEQKVILPDNNFNKKRLVKALRAVFNIYFSQAVPEEKPQPPAEDNPTEVPPP